MSALFFEHIKPLTNPEEIKYLRARVQQVAGYSQHESPWLIKQQDWVAVPVESGDHFSQEEQSNLLQCLQKYGYQEMFAVAFKNIGKCPSEFLVEDTPEAI